MHKKPNVRQDSSVYLYPPVPCQPVNRSPPPDLPPCPAKSSRLQRLAGRCPVPTSCHDRPANNGGFPCFFGVIPGEVPTMGGPIPCSVFRGEPGLAGNDLHILSVSLSPFSLILYTLICIPLPCLADFFSSCPDVVYTSVTYYRIKPDCHSGMALGPNRPFRGQDTVP